MVGDARETCRRQGLEPLSAVPKLRDWQQVAIGRFPCDMPQACLTPTLRRRVFEPLRPNKKPVFRPTLYLVELTGQSSNQNALFSRLAEALPALLRRKKPKAKLARQRQVQRRLTAHQVEQLVAEYQSGADMAVLAARWSLRRTGVELR